MCFGCGNRFICGCFDYKTAGAFCRYPGDCDCFALLAASYTIPGGLSSAINAEIIQACILIVGSVLLAIYVTVSGGFDYLKELFISGDYMVKLIRPLDDSSTPWLALIIGMPITGLYFGQTIKRWYSVY